MGSMMITPDGSLERIGLTTEIFQVNFMKKICMKLNKTCNIFLQLKAVSYKMITLIWYSKVWTLSHKYL